MDNHSQREMAFLTEARKAVDVPIEFVRACKDELEALNLCINLSNLSDESIREALGIDKGHFSRMRKGRGNFPARKRLHLMAICGNRAPAQFEALHLHCDLVEKSKDALIRELEAKLALARMAA